LAGTQTNTTALIAEWSMDGARSDLGGRFESALDIDAIVAERDRRSRHEASPPTLPPLLLKPVDEDDWLPLAATGS